jgi:hypothetical protein
MTRIASFFDVSRGDLARAQQLQLSVGADVQVSPREHYGLLKAYYLNNSLYTLVNQAAVAAGIWSPAMKPLRNPCNRIVEFYPSMLWPGCLPEALPVETDNPRLSEAVETVWAWSNWTAGKQLAARYLAAFGDLFLRVAQTGDGRRVYIRVLDPADVTDFEADERGFLTYVRIDTVQGRRLGDRGTSRVTTEVFDKALDSYRMWVNETNVALPEDQLGTPVVEKSMSVDFGITFIPIAHAKFRDIGELRGQAAILPMLDKVDEANRQATRLAQMMFRYNKATWAVLAGGLDPGGRPLPPPSVIRGRNGHSAVSDGSVTLGDDELLELPGNASITALVPNLQYADFLAMIEATMRELEQDAPELTYYRVAEQSDLSGRALRYMLGSAIKRVEEVRGYGEYAIVRADQMAVTIAQAASLDGFDVGTFDNGDLDHRFRERDVIPISEEERASIDSVEANTAVIKREKLGVSRVRVLEELGYGEDDITMIDEELAAENALPVVEQ